jgi:histidinol dehydrogenase
MKRIVIQTDTDRDAAVERIKGLMLNPEAERALQEKTDATRRIVDAVRERGDAAVAEFTERFDGVALRPEQFEITSDEIDRAVEQVSPEILRALQRAYENISLFHGQNLRQSWELTSEDGTVLGQRVTPLESVGVYVPGGKAFYPSSVLMNIAPAQVAGVREIVMVSPPSHNGSIHPAVLAAARLAGATRIFRVGGAQAIAALAYGTEHIPAVLKITGPGNTFVAVAKRLVTSICAIDTEAGPSEVVVIADETADPQRCALELLAQAEHDEEACCTLIALSEAFAEEVERAVAQEMQTLERRGIIQKALDGQGTIIIARSLDEAAELTSLIAPEHLALYTREPETLLDKIPNAGAAMLGDMTPVAVGDYFAGPNHILPTGRRARFASPLTAEDFRKVTSIIKYSAARMKQDADDIMRLAQAEKLTAHARAIEIRK